jgi:hypothetical protein
MKKELPKNKKAAAVSEEEKKAAAARLEREREIEIETAEWREKYFKDIVFPVVILAKRDYLVVSSLADYYYDLDINVHFIRADDELVDSTGQKYDFMLIERKQWIPNEKTGTMKYDELRNRLVPLLYMPNHKKGINKTKTIKDIIELLLKN